MRGAGVCEIHYRAAHLIFDNFSGLKVDEACSSGGLPWWWTILLTASRRDAGYAFTLHS